MTRSLYILVADEVLSNVRYVTDWLQAHGHRVETSARGTAAVAAARRRSEQGTPYDLIIVDLNLPGLDGMALARELRQHGDLTPVIVHATAAASDPALGAAAGVLRLVHILDRPLDLSLIERELAAIGSHRPHQGAATDATFFGAARPGAPHAVEPPPATGRYSAAPHLVDDEGALERRDVPTSASGRLPRSAMPESAPPALAGLERRPVLPPQSRPGSTGAHRIGSGEHRASTSRLGSGEHRLGSGAHTIGGPEGTHPITGAPLSPPPGSQASASQPLGRPIRTTSTFRAATLAPATTRVSSAPTTATTSRIRRGVTGVVAVVPAGTPPAAHAVPAADRTVACAYCGVHFLVAVKPITYTTVCVHCGKLNRIDP